MKNLTLLSFLILGLIACTGDEEDLLPVNFDAEVELSLWQTLPVAENNLQILVTNVEAFDCQNTTMLSNFSSGSTSVDLEILGFERPATCQPGDGFITTALDLTSEPDRFINFTNQGVLTEGKLRISDRTADITFSSINNDQLVELSINRIPEGLVWGYINRTIDQSADINMLLQQEFPDALIEATAFDMLPGSYGHFRIDMNPVIDRYVLTEIVGETDLAQPILFRLNPDRWSDLSDFMIEAAEKSNFGYEIYNSQGAVIRN